MVEIDFDLYRKYLPYIAEAMMRNGVMANDIEQIYAQSEANYYSLYKDYAPNGDGRLISSGTLKREISLKHCVAVLLAAESDNQVRTLLMKACAANYSEPFVLAKKASPKLYDWLMRKNQQEKTEIVNTSLRLGYYFLFLLHGTKFEASSSVEQVIHMAEQDIIRQQPYCHIRESTEKIIQNNIGPISTMLQNYRAVRSCADIRRFMDDIDFPQRNPFQTTQPISNVFQAAMREAYLITAGLMDINDMSFALLLEDRKLGKKDLQSLALCLLRLQENEKTGTGSYDKTAKYALLYYMGVIFLSMLKEYSNAKKLCDERIDHEILVENKSLAKSNKQLRKRVDDLEQALSQCRHSIASLEQDLSQEKNAAALYDESSMLRNSLQQLQEEQKQWESERYDYNRLKELAFELDSAVPSASPEPPNIHDILERHRIFIFGGHENWHQQLKKEFPELNIVSGTLHSMSPEVFRTAEYVLIFAGHMAHTVFNKGIAFLRQNEIPYSYLSQSNLDYLQKKIAEIYGEGIK